MRGHTILISFFCLGILIPCLAAAQTPGTSGPSPLTQYRQKALGARFSFFKGLELTREGRPVSLGFFGGNAPSLFDGSDEALESMESYRALRISGTILWATGLAVLLTEVVLLVTDKDIFIEEKVGGNEIKPLFWGLLGGGAVIGITGGIMMQGANGYLSDAIGQYNDDLAKGLQSRRALRSWPSSLCLSYRGTF